MYGCGLQEEGVASGSGWILWVWLAGGECVYSGCGCKVYIHFLILLIPTPLVSALFGSSISTFLFIFVNVFRPCSCPFFVINFM